MAEKPLQFLGSSLNDLRDFPDAARRLAGHQLHLVQHGLEPDDWKPMTTVGAGVTEIRVHTDVEHRVFYVAKFADTGRGSVTTWPRVAPDWCGARHSERGLESADHRGLSRRQQSELHDHGQGWHRI